jgi:hypothetical protein
MSKKPQAMRELDERETLDEQEFHALLDVADDDPLTAEQEERLRKEWKTRTEMKGKSKDVDRLELLEVLKLLRHGLMRYGFAKRERAKQIPGQGFFFKQDRITTYNGRVCLSAAFPTGVSGSVPGKEFLASLAKLQEPRLRITQDDKGINIAAGRTALAFPAAPDLDSLEKETAELMVEERNWRRLPPDFFEALEATRFSAATDGLLGPLASISFQGGYAYSTDNWRATRFTLKGTVPEAFHVSSFAADILLRLPRSGAFSVGRYCTEQGRIHFKAERLLFSARTVEEEYPKRAAALFRKRQPVGRIELPKEQIAAAVKEGLALIKPHFNLEHEMFIRLGFRGSKVTVSSRTPAFRKGVNLAGEVKEPFVIKVHPRHFSEALERFQNMTPPYDIGKKSQAVGFEAKGSRHLVAVEN